MLLVVQSWQLAVLSGILALATAPATTVLVLRENESEGPVTEYSLALVVFNNMVAIVAFEAVLVGILYLNDAAPVSAHEQLLRLGLDLFLSVALGIGGGLLVTYACGLLSQNRSLVVVATDAISITSSSDVPSRDQASGEYPQNRCNWRRVSPLSLPACSPPRWCGVDPSGRTGNCYLVLPAVANDTSSIRHRVPILRAGFRRFALNGKTVSLKARVLRL